MIFVSEVIAWAAKIFVLGTENDEYTIYEAVISDERATETWNEIWSTCDEETLSAGGLGSDGGETWNENGEQLVSASGTWNETWI